MNKILLIAQREFLVRIRKKSFIIMTILGPFLFGFAMIVPVWMSTKGSEKTTIQVLDKSGLDISNKLIQNTEFDFVITDGDLLYIKEVFAQSPNEGLLYIPKIDLDNPDGITYYSKSNIDIETQQKINRIVKTELQNKKLELSGIGKEFLENIWTKMNIQTISIDAGEEQKSFAEANAIAGLTSAVLIYFFIFLYGTLVLRGVIDEKSNRIVEVIITSVRPFQLMMGKILGIATMALIQFLIWMTLTFAISGFINSRFQMNRFSSDNIDQTLAKLKPGDINNALEMNKTLVAIESINFPLMLTAFLFYFFIGYLLYAALFAAIGAAVDGESDSQQFMLPVTIPLIISFVFAQTIINDPDSSLAIWLSIIPLTSPVTMMVRIPFGVPWWQLLISMSLLFAAFIVCTWISAKIYRVGILMYGKKPSYYEIWKWIKYS
ncbi:MAG: ABC transporter permease [Bacteroidota bacterium]|nr:ABC transporter permease [Bacteroidota bacterium]